MTESANTAARVSTSLYADDTSSLVASGTWAETDKAMNATADSIEEYSLNNGLHLNPGKTQTLKISHRDTDAGDTLDVLGVEINKTVGFTTHHSKMISDLKRRVGVIRRLATKMSRGKLLSEIARTLVIGKLQTNAWVTRRARLSPGPQHGDDLAAQRVLNDLARMMLGVKRADRLKSSDLSDRTNLPTVNQIVVQQSAMAAWKTEHGGPLDDALVAFDDRTRGSSYDLRRPASSRCQPACNMAEAWNASELLRLAKTPAEAKSAAKRLAHSVRHI